MTLYDIQGEYLRLYELATNEEDPQAFLDTLESLNADLAEKSAGYVSVIKQLDMESDECDKVIEAFKRKKEVRQNNIKRMKEALLGAMDTAGLTEIQAGNYTLKIAKNGGKLPMTVDEGKVPDNYMKIKYEPDNERIRKTLELGIELNFARLEERGKHLNIK